MSELLLGPMLRHVTETSATIFIETDSMATVAINGVETQTFAVAGHHYALVMLEALEPGSCVEYTVNLDGIERWPLPGMPASVIRTLGHDGPLRILVGSCRAAAPHELPFTLSPTVDAQGLGVDALRAHGQRMQTQPREEWPDLLLLLGDQLYADEPSPVTRRRMSQRPPEDPTPPDLVGGFEEYTWLYHESWQPDVERWMFSVVPTAMIFDDHDVIDDWNISMSWVNDIRKKAWWNNHIVGGLMSYWIYQHLGNLSPDEIRSEGMLEHLLSLDRSTGEAAADYLHEWAQESERLTPIEGGYRFSFARQLGATRLVVIDCRNGRNLRPDRQMIGESEWHWVEEQARIPADHLLLGTSLPVMVPGGLHGLQEWNAALCDGRWGKPIARLSEKLRRFLDLEDWPAFDASLRRLLSLIDDIRMGPSAPATISILSGDIHFSFIARASFLSDSSTSKPVFEDRRGSAVHQIVSSPIRQSLSRRDRRLMDFAAGRIGRRIGGLLTRSVTASAHQAAWEITHGPEFANDMALLTIEQRTMRVAINRARLDESGRPLLETVIDAEM